MRDRAAATRPATSREAGIERNASRAHVPCAVASAGIYPQHREERQSNLPPPDRHVRRRQPPINRASPRTCSGGSPECLESGPSRPQREQQIEPHEAQDNETNDDPEDCSSRAFSCERHVQTPHTAGAAPRPTESALVTLMGGSRTLVGAHS